MHPRRESRDVGSTQSIHGRITDSRIPDWRPLEDLAPDHLGDFMWMFEVALDDGSRVQAYKHRETRGYLHLDENGGAFVFGRDRRYHEIAPRRLLDAVLRLP